MDTNERARLDTRQPRRHERLMSRSFDVATSLLASCVRLGAGTICRDAAVRPDELLELYEFEGCPYCRLVREALTELDLDALIYPCPKRGARYRPKVQEMGGKQQFPYFVDPNTGTRCYESRDIIRYLYDRYGSGRRPPLHLAFRPYAVAGSAMTSAVRLHRGSWARPARAPAVPLELWSFEASPFSRLVREVLCEFELPYVLHSAGRADMRDHVPLRLRPLLGLEVEPSTDTRRSLAMRAGKVQLPYLVDPNTGTETFESAAVVQYLRDTYAS